MVENKKNNFYSDLPNIKIRLDNRDIIAIKKNINIFSYICAFCIFFILIFIYSKIVNRKDILLVFVFSGSLLFSILLKKVIYNYGIHLAKKKYNWLLNDIIIFKFHFKKIFGISLLTIISFGMLFLIFILMVIPNIDVSHVDNMILGAHRGDSVRYIENTLPAIKSALENESYQFIEFDVQYTKDKKIIVYHDSNLIRLHHKLYSISSLTYDDLLNVSDYHIPLYSEVMDLVGNKKCLNIEIKSQGNLIDDKKIVDFIMDDIDKRDLVKIVLFSSISSDVIRYINEQYPDVKTGIIYYITSDTFLESDERIINLYTETENLGADYLMLYASNLRNYYNIQKMKPENIDIIIWYFNNEMYILNSDENEIINKKVNILGYSIKEKNDISWDNLRFFKKI